MIKAMHHIGFCVTDMEKIITFYQDVLGLDKTDDFEMSGEFLDTVQGQTDMNYRIVKFMTPDGYIMEFLDDRGHAVAPQRKNCLQSAGLRHFALEVENVDLMYERVKSFGFETISEPCTSEDGSMRLFFVRDPERNLVELMQFPQ